MNTTKITRRGYYQNLPFRAREIVHVQLANMRNQPGPGDGYIYEWIEDKPPTSYAGSMPYVTAIRRVRRYSFIS